MALKALKCPQCGANLELDDSREIGFCEYCGAKVQIREVIEVRHKVDNSEQLSNYKMLGERAYGVKNYSEALNYYSKAIEFAPNDPECLYRRAFCKVYTKQIKDINISEFSNEITSAIKYASQEDLNQIESELVFWYDKLFRDLSVNQNLFTVPSLCELQIYKIVTFLSFAKVIISLLRNDKDKENLLLRTINLCDQKTYLNLKYGEIGSGKYTSYRTSQQNINTIQNIRNEFSNIYNNLPSRVNELKEAQKHFDKVSSELADLKNRLKGQKKQKDTTVKNPERKSFNSIPIWVITSLVLLFSGWFLAYLTSTATYEDGSKATFGVSLFMWSCLFIPVLAITIPIAVSVISSMSKKYYIGKPLIQENCNADKVYNLKIQYYTKAEEFKTAQSELARIQKKQK